MIVGSWWAKAEPLSGVAVRRRVSRWCVQSKADRGGSNTTSFVTLRDGMHFLVVQLRVVYQAIMVSSGVTELAIALVAATFTIAAAEMARQPRGRHLGVFAMNKATRVDNVPHKNGQPHWCRLQDVQGRLITRKRVARAQTGGELDKAVDDSNGDCKQASVKRPDQPSPASNLVCSQTSDSFSLKLVPVKLEDQTQEQNNETLLHANTAHVYVQALLL